MIAPAVGRCRAQADSVSASYGIKKTNDFHWRIILEACAAHAFLIHAALLKRYSFDSLLPLFRFILKRL